MPTKISCSTSRSNYVPLWLCIGLALTSACAADEKARDCIDEGTPPSTPSYPDGVYHRSRVRVTQSVVYDAAGTPTRDNSASADFSDMTLAERKSRVGAALFQDQACLALTGSPSLECRKEGGSCTAADIVAMTAQQVELEGLGSGPLALTSTNGGKGFMNDSLGEPLFQGGELKVTVTGSAEAGSFPSYEQTIPAPDPLVLERPAVGESTPLGTGDVSVRWEPGNGDFIVLEIGDVDPTVTDKAQCILKDDGCHTVLAEVFEWLQIGQGQRFKLTLVRVREAVEKLDSQSAADMKAVSQLEAEYVR